MDWDSHIADLRFFSSRLDELARELELEHRYTRVTTPPPPTPDVPAWLQVARAELGVREIPGREHNPRVLEYLAETQLAAWGRTRDETPWCSAFVCWVLHQCALESTRSAAAFSYEGYGRPLERPKLGCIVVLTRPAANEDWARHVGFFEGLDGADILLLGGNQGNCVSVLPYPVSRVRCYREPILELEAVA